MDKGLAGLKTGDKIGKATVIIDLVPKGNPEIRPGIVIDLEYATVHNTGNSGKGADAKAHNTLIHNLANKPPRDTTHTSWHVTGDDKFIYIHIPLNEMAWHCGDGAKGTGNTKSFGYEICMHSDQKDYAQAEENAIAFIAHVFNYYNLPAKNAKPHQNWSGKYCPAVILKRDGTFGKFAARIDAACQLYNLKEDDELVFTSPTLRTSYEKRLKSPGTSKLLDDAAIKVLGHKSKLKNGRLSDGDMSAIAMELAVYYAKKR